jgi:hypothetical protein
MNIQIQQCRYLARARAKKQSTANSVIGLFLGIRHGQRPAGAAERP